LVLTDSRQKLILFGVDPTLKDDIYIDAGIAFFAGHADANVELFDVDGKSWGHYQTPKAAQSFFKIKAQAVRMYKSTIQT
jgi:hypothetical protein